MTIRARWSVTPEHECVSRLQTERLRSLRPIHESVRTATGVDLATGRVLLRETDVVLPGALPVCLFRTYDSSWSSRVGALGAGWVHSFEQRVWLEHGRVVYLADDGREVEFDTFLLPGRTARPGDEVADYRRELSMRRRSASEWRVQTRVGTQRVFRQRDGNERDARARLIGVKDRAGNEIKCEYDALGVLVGVRSSAGRGLRFEYNDDGYLARVLRAGTPDTTEVVCTYSYGRDGLLAAVTSAGGVARRYAWDSGLLVEHRDAADFATYYGYDGIGDDARCVETWCSRGIHHARLSSGNGTGNVVATNSLGDKLSLECDVVHSIKRLGTTRFDHDELFRTIAHMDAGGAVHRAQYDEVGRVTGLWSADGAITRVFYEVGGRPERLFDANKGEWNWRYDANGNLVEATNPAGESTSFENGGGLCRAIIIPSRGRTELRYGAGQQIEAIVRADGGIARIEYDRAGRVAYVVDPTRFGTTIRYDDDGRIAQVVGGDGFGHEYRRDATGRIRSVHGFGRSVSWRYMADGWVTARVEADGRQVEMRYNAEGALVGVRSEADDYAFLYYDAHKRPTREIQFDKSTRRYVYGKDARIAKVSLPGKARMVFERDAMGRITSVASSDRRVERYEWNADGTIASASAGDNVVRFERDGVGRTVREWQGDVWVESRYDPAGDRVEVRTSLGARHVTIRNELGLPATVCVGDPARAQWRIDLTYDGSDREIVRSFPGEVQSQWDRDHAGRPLKHTLWIRGKPIFERMFAWNADGVSTGIHDNRFGTTYHEYDPAGRLTGWRVEGGERYRRRLDAIGDPFRSGDGSDSGYNRGGRIVRSGDTTFRHDALGNIVSATSADGRAWTYEYSTSGLLVRVGLPDGRDVHYEYDAFGRRIRKTLGKSTLQWIWDGNVIIHDVSSDEGVTTWIWLPDDFGLVAKVKNGRYFGAVTDQVGAPLALIGTDSAVMWSGQVNPWGDVQKNSSRTRCPWRFEGHYQDDDAMLQFARYRPYSPKTGRYFTPNPLGLHGGTNPYRFVDNPVWERDPWGLVGAGLSSGATAVHDRLVPFAQFTIDRVAGDVATALARVAQPDVDAMVRKWLPRVRRHSPYTFDASKRPVGWQSPEPELVPLPEY